MKIDSFPFTTISWDQVPKETKPGESGQASWQVQNVNNIRVRLVEYSENYKADHWCKKGHILFCMEGEMETELEDGRIVRLTEGMCYFIGDNNEAHRSSTKNGCRLFIVD